MTDRWTGQIGVLADPHLHDTGAGHAYGLETKDCFRSLAESTASTRVFNEVFVVRIFGTISYLNAASI